MSEGKNVIEVKNLRAVVHEEGQDITRQQLRRS